LGKRVVTVKAMLNNAGGLAEDAVVKFKGVDVGKVRKISLENGKVVLDLFIEEKYRVPKNVKCCCPIIRFSWGKIY